MLIIVCSVLAIITASIIYDFIIHVLYWRRRSRMAAADAAQEKLREEVAALNELFDLLKKNREATDEE